MADSTQQSPPTKVRQAKEYHPLPAETAIIKRVEERIAATSRGSSRWALERQMFEAIAFCLGTQWLSYDVGSQRLTQWKAPAWFPTPVQNEIGPRSQAMLARVLRSQPRALVRPGSTDPADQEGARVGEKMLVHFDDVTHEAECRHEAALYAVQTGSAVFEDYWDSEAGQLLAIPRTKPAQLPMNEPSANCPQCGFQGDFEMLTTSPLCPQCSATLEQGERQQTLPDGTPMTTMGEEPELDEAGEPVVDYIPEGELCTRVRLLFNFYHDVKATSATLRDARWVGEAQYTDLAWIDEHFPGIGECVAEESGIDSNNFYETALLGLVGPSIQGTAHHGGAAAQQGGAVIRRYQERPCREYPKGLYAVVAHGVLLHPRPNELGEIPPDACALPIKDKNGQPTGDFTYTMWVYDVVPGRVAGGTPCNDMVPLQRQVNGITAQKILNRKTFINPWLLAPKGSGFNQGQSALQPGAVLLYNTIATGATPQIVPGQPLPDSVDKEKQDCIDAMDRLAQDVQLGQATTPESMKSGITVSFLREQKDEVAVPRMQRWAECLKERGRKRLLLAAQHYREQRAVKIMGEGSDWQVRYWAGADLQGQTDVVVDPASIIPVSKSQRNQLMLDAVEAGVIDLTDPMQRQKVIEGLQLFEFQTEIAVDQRRARKENASLDQGMPVPINRWDNHEIHLYEHYQVIKDPAHDSKPPEALLAHEQHVMMHEQQVAIQMAQQQAAMAQQQAAQNPNGNGKGNGKAPPLDSPGGGAEAQAVAAA